MDIILVPVGDVDPVTLDMLKDDVREILQKPVSIV